MKKLVVVTILLAASFVSSLANANGQQINDLKIKMIRAVGNYHAGDTFDNSIELWFTASLEWAENMNCSINYRVYIDASHTHLISAAYMAFASGKTVNIHADDSLPLRSGSCELSYIDVNL
jgi:hypothetical protein